MDPLSITTSILTLIGAASKTYGLLQFISNADEDITSLCVEVSGLESVLFSIQAALKKCGSNPLNLASIDQDLWRRIDMTLSDSRETLDNLSQLVQRIRIKHSALVPGLLYRARVAKRLQQHTRDVGSYRDRIRMSNWNLQTLLQVIDVSLSLANRDSQAHMACQLDLLNQRVQDRVPVSLCLNRSNSTSERRFLHNVEDFVLAIKAFHKSASTSAGTVQGNSGHAQDTTGETEHYGTTSVVFRMPTRKRHEIVTQLQRNEKQEQVATTSTALQASNAMRIISPLDGPQLAPFRLNLTSVFTDGFSKLAHRAIQDLDFFGAETFLRRAMEHHRDMGIDSVQHRRLRKQLSLSLFFQGRDREAKELVLDLAEHYGEGFNTTSQLLFALALSLAHELEFDEARAICEQLCQIRCISDDGYSGMLSKNDIFKLLVTCYRQSRDWMSADAIIAEIPDIDEEHCIPSPLEFILASDDLLLEFLGDAECRTTPSIFVSQVQRLPVAKRVTRLQERLDGASIVTTRFAVSESGDDHGGDGLLRLKSRHLGSAPQAVQNRPTKKHASLRAAHARLTASLKHLAFKSRLYSSFELLQWQRCTPEVEKTTPVRDILSWMEGQAAGHGMTLVTDRFPDDADYSLDISDFPISSILELDSVEITNATILPQFEEHDRASHTIPLALSMEYGVDQYSREELEAIPEFSNFDPIHDLRSKSIHSHTTLCHELLGSMPIRYPLTFPVFESTEEHGNSSRPSIESIGCPRTTEKDPANLLEIPVCNICQWNPDSSNSRSLNRLRAAVAKHVKRNHSKEDSKCPVCYQVFKNRPDNLKPHVARKHPEKLLSLFPTAMQDEISRELRFVED